MEQNIQPWEIHYERPRSRLSYPDENLVRMIRPWTEAHADPAALSALDLGCGSGRHLALLAELGIAAPIGLDLSAAALTQCRDIGMRMLVRSDNTHIALRAESVDIVIAWGSLHYCRKDTTARMIAEIHRILRPGGALFGTLRTDRDSYLRRGEHLGGNTWITDLSDIKQSIASFFSEDELRDLFPSFPRFRFGLMERSVLGDTGRMISHWFYTAEK